MTAPPIPPDLARRIWAILAEECGSEGEQTRNGFLIHVPDGCREYRFCGHLGFGGKFYAERDRWRVGCYREDETPDRLAMIARANARLAALRDEMEQQPA